jgi:hypothetical protein
MSFFIERLALRSLEIFICFGLICCTLLVIGSAIDVIQKGF